MAKQYKYPFTAILGQEKMKQALVLNLVDPGIGGVLIRGQKGTAKSTAVRALADMMPDMGVVELPLGATEDRVVGTLDVEAAIQTGEKKFEPGILAEADGNLLYVDEINLLEDHLVDLLLDAAAMGVNTVEREGISYSHSAKFALVGTMNPEEGNLRPQLLDRFGMVVDVAGEPDPEVRAKIIESRLAYDADPQKFAKRYYRKQKALRDQITAARERLPMVTVDHDIIMTAAEIGIAFETEGHRADIGMIRVSKAVAALENHPAVTKDDLMLAAEYTLPHRMRKNPLQQGNFQAEELKKMFDHEPDPEDG